jgi:hypothetical protein
MCGFVHLSVCACIACAFVHQVIHLSTQTHDQLYLSAKLGWTRASIAPTAIENSENVLLASVPYKFEQGQVFESTAIAGELNHVT